MGALHEHCKLIVKSQELAAICALNRRLFLHKPSNALRVFASHFLKWRPFFERNCFMTAMFLFMLQDRHLPFRVFAAVTRSHTLHLFGFGILSPSGGLKY